MEWTGITRGEVNVRGINSRYHEMLDVEMELSAGPPASWERAFANPMGVEMSGGRRAPRLSGATVQLLVAQRDLEASVKEVDARIAYANDFYAQRVLPELQAEEAQKEKDRQADQALVDEGRSRAKKL